MQLLGQDAHMCTQITAFIAYSLPCVLFEGLNDLYLKFYIQKGQYKLQKYIEIAGAVI